MTQPNPSSLKNLINLKETMKLAQVIATYYPDFSLDRFQKKIKSQIEALELKSRAQLIADVLTEELPQDFNEAQAILKNVLASKKIRGFVLWGISEWIVLNGLKRPEVSFELMKLMTPQFTAEFAIRPFIERYPKKTLDFLVSLAKSSDVHLRRLASEGSRPFLPWGGTLPYMISNPHDSLMILNLLKYDPKLYVRKSVANHLNDISKFNPELVLMTLKVWQGQIQNQNEQQKKDFHWLTCHALRTLIKKGNPEALKLIGIKPNLKIKLLKFNIQNSTIKLGNSLSLEVHLQSLSQSSEEILVDFILYFLKKDQSLSPKVFKLKRLKLRPKQKVHLTKKVTIKKITTRRYYSGTQYLSILINGEETKKTPWDLIV